MNRRRLRLSSVSHLTRGAARFSSDFTRAASLRVRHPATGKTQMCGPRKCREMRRVRRKRLAAEEDLTHNFPTYFPTFAGRRPRSVNLARDSSPLCFVYLLVASHLSLSLSLASLFFSRLHDRAENRRSRGSRFLATSNGRQMLWAKIK